MPAAPVRATMTVAGFSRAVRAARSFPAPSSREISAGPAAANGGGNSVSSIVSAATPAASNSCTVRIAFSALP